MQETQVQSLGGEDLLEKEMATHSSILARKIPWMEEPDMLQSKGSQRVGHDCWTSLTPSVYPFICWWAFICLSPFGYFEQSCCKHSCKSSYVNIYLLLRVEFLKLSYKSIFFHFRNCLSGLQNAKVFKILSAVYEGSDISFICWYLLLSGFLILHLVRVITHQEPDIQECEIKWVLGSITTNKVTAGDGIPVELFQILKDDAVKVVHVICQQIWKTQQWPQDWKRSVFIPILKKGNAKEYSKLCTIALISRTSKVMLKIF